MADDFDAAGWAQIHHASQRGFIKSIDFFLKDDPEILELETIDEKHLTPFLCAVDGGKTDSIQYLMEAGAKVTAIDAFNHGAIEICALKFYIEVLEYFMKLDDDRLPTWKHLLRFLKSESDDEAEPAGRCLRTLTQGSKEGGMSPHWEEFYKHGGVVVAVNVCKGTISDEAKIPTFQTLLNVIPQEEVREQILSCGGIPVFIKLLKSPCHHAVQLSAEILKELAKFTKYAESQAQNNAIPSLVKVLQSIHDPEVLYEAIECLGNIGEGRPKLQNQVGTSPGCIETIINMFEGQKDKKCLHALSDAVGKIADNETNNQNMFVEKGVTTHIVVLTGTRNHDIQVSAVEAIHKLSDNNSHTQKVMLADSIQELLLRLLKNTRSKICLEKTALALWALAGSDFDIKRYMAEKMEVSRMIEFINSMSENLHYIGAEGLGILAQGAKNYQSEIAKLNGITPLGRLIQSDKEHIVLSVVRAIRFLCVGVGYVPHHQNQNTILQFRGIKHLVALMVHSWNELIQVESALTLGCVSMANQSVLDDIYQNVDFSYVRILKMMYAEDEMVRLLAGAALAAFSYNNINQQKVIAEQGGVRFNCFVPFLQSNDEFFRCNAAFQVVVLSRIIPDEEQALSSAAGIKLLVDILQESSSKEILALAADCIARLGHTRAGMEASKKLAPTTLAWDMDARGTALAHSNLLLDTEGDIVLVYVSSCSSNSSGDICMMITGVPSAVVSIEAVELLSKLLASPAEQVRGNAAIALGYLSYNHAAERQLLNKCRTDPYLIRVLLHYTKLSKISPAFLTGWKHYKKVGLPPIPEGRPSLIGFKPDGIIENRSFTMLSIEETNSNTRSTSNLMEEEGRGTRRSSRASGSRNSNHTGTPRQDVATPLGSGSPAHHGSQMSLDSQRSSNSLLPPEVTTGAD